MWRLSRELAPFRFDLAILLQNAFEAALIAMLARIPVRAGYNTDGRSLFLTHPITLKRDVKKLHQVHYYQGMLQKLGLTPGPDELFLRMPDTVQKWAHDIKTKLGEGPVIGLNPGAAYGPAKRWPAEKYGELAKKLHHDLKATFLVFGTKADEEASVTIQSYVPEHVKNLAGNTTLAEAMALIGECDAFVTNDSGLMHVGAALKTPLIAIFGSTDDVATGPFSDNSVVIRKDLACSPCLETDCKTDFRCMMDIQSTEVAEAVKKLLANNFN